MKRDYKPKLSISAYYMNKIAIHSLNYNYPKPASPYIGTLLSNNAGLYAGGRSPMSPTRSSMVKPQGIQLGSLEGESPQGFLRAQNL